MPLVLLWMRCCEANAVCSAPAETLTRLLLPISFLQLHFFLFPSTSKPRAEEQITHPSPFSFHGDEVTFTSADQTEALPNFRTEPFVVQAEE